MSQLYAKLEFCEERCRRVSSTQRCSINPAVLEELRLTKQSLVELDSRAGAVRQVLLDTLDDDEDIADFTISSTATSEEDKEDEEEEVENLIEYYLQQTETVHNAAEQLLENTRDLEESISVSLSSRRYEVSKLELTLSIATFAAALVALVTGIFGMNLRSCLEMSVSRSTSRASSSATGSAPSSRASAVREETEDPLSASLFAKATLPRSARDQTARCSGVVDRDEASGEADENYRPMRAARH